MIMYFFWYWSEFEISSFIQGPLAYFPAPASNFFPEKSFSPFTKTIRSGKVSYIFFKKGFSYVSGNRTF